MTSTEYLNKTKLIKTLKIVSLVPCFIGLILFFVLPVFKASLIGIEKEWAFFDLYDTEPDTTMAGFLLFLGLWLIGLFPAIGGNVLSILTLKQSVQKQLWKADAKPEQIEKAKAKAASGKWLIIFAVFAGVALILGIVLSVVAFSKFRNDLDFSDAIDTSMGSGSILLLILALLTSFASVAIEVYNYLLVRKTEPAAVPQE